MMLSSKQQIIVDHGDGAILVEAGPGSGKTRVLIERIKKLLLASKRGKVLALTFSNLAAEEMKERLNEDDIDDYHDRLTVGTIHSFCLDLVLSRGYLIGLEPDMVLFENEEDRQAVLKGVFADNPEFQNYAIQGDVNKLLQRYLQLITEQKRNFITPDNCTVNEPFPLIYEEYNRKLLDQNAMDFDDILFFAYRILTENPNVVNIYNKIYKYICIDEAQDLNLAQYLVIKALCGENFTNVMLVGDPNQSIYGFNGSSSRYMTESFVADFSPTIYKLNENYRSSKKIVEFANRLEQYDSTANYVYDGELSAVKLEDEFVEARYIVDKIEALIKIGHPDIEGALTTNRFAIIARNRYVFSHLETELSSRNIPYYFRKNITGIENESDFMKVFELSLRVLINKKDYLHLQQLEKIVGKKADKSLCDSMTLLQDLLRSSAFDELLPSLLILNSDTLNFRRAMEAIEEILPHFGDDERYLIAMDIEQWKKHWTKYCLLIPRENRTLSSFRNQISLGKTKDSESSSGIALLTAHMSKGLQFDVVFIMGLCEGTFPDYRAIKEGTKQLSQEKNNMYVAVTRAKRLCYMTYPEKKRMPWGDIKYQQPSRYIKDIV